LGVPAGAGRNLHPAMEAWVEVNVVAAAERDAGLISGLVDRIVNGALATELETWFFFWEPELRLRLRWRDPDRAQPCGAVLAAELDESHRRGAIGEWYEGAHGVAGERYQGEADLYGTEVWELVQKDWMNGSEFALLLAKLERAGALTRPRRFHWERHVHLFTNQLYGSWEAEVELCLAQALGYLRHIRAFGAEPSEATTELVSKLQALAAQ
jgi:hypothetical protein